MEQDRYFKERENVEKDMSDFFKGFGKSVYATFASVLRMPTLARRIANRQDYFHRLNESAELTGAVMGFCVAGLGTVYAVREIISEFKDGNYIPLAVAGGAYIVANLASCAFEFGRLSRDREIEKSLEKELVKAE